MLTPLRQIAEFVALNLGVETSAEGPQRTAILLEKCYKLIYGDVTGAPAAAPAAARSSAAVEIEVPVEMMDVNSWYWQETPDLISRHNPSDVIADNFVSYAGSVCGELDRKYHAYTHSGGPAQVTVDLNDRIGSTGTEQKAHNAETGVIFEIDFYNMSQRNVKSSFKRPVKRVPTGRQQPLNPTASRPMMPTAGVPMGVPVGENEPTMVFRQSSEMPLKPPELVDEDALIIRKGQLIQTSKQRPDGWAFGSVVLDIMEDRPPLGIDGLSNQAGWFPKNEYTTHPSKEQMQQLQALLGGDDAGSALAHPSTWDAMVDPNAVKIVKLDDGPEKKMVVDWFQKTLIRRKITVVSVERVQNLSMWQSFAVKRQAVLQRENESKDKLDNDLTNPSHFERIWLFHGTDEGTVPKIIEMGFNRSFCGKNATAFGKGVYFARDADYSAQPQYAAKNAKGICQMFLCRVTVGEFCLGQRDALTPEIRKGHQLYDSTVGPSMADPYIFVTYHDAQAYPEYLVKYKM